MKKWLIGLGVLLGVVLISGAAYWQTQFFVVSTSPKNNDPKAPTSGSVIIRFNQKLDPSTAQRFSIQPQTIGQVKVDGNKLIFTPAGNLLLHTNYRVLLTNPISASGKVAKSVELSFRAEFVGFSDLPAEDQQRQINATDSLENRYKITQYLPQSTLDYRDDYRINDDQTITLLITLKATFNRPDQRNLYLQELKQYKKEALDYIRSKGEDPAKYKIEYDPQEAASL